MSYHFFSEHVLKSYLEISAASFKYLCHLSCFVLLKKALIFLYDQVSCTIHFKYPYWPICAIKALV